MLVLTVDADWVFPAVLRAIPAFFYSVERVLVAVFVARSLPCLRLALADEAAAPPDLLFVIVLVVTVVVCPPAGT